MFFFQKFIQSIWIFSVKPTKKMFCVDSSRLCFIFVFFPSPPKKKSDLDLVHGFNANMIKCYACLMVRQWYIFTKFPLISWNELSNLLNDSFVAKSIFKILWVKSQFSSFFHCRSNYLGLANNFLRVLSSPLRTPERWVSACSKN